MAALLLGLAGFGLGLFFGWLLHRERFGDGGTTEGTRDRATAALADTSARLELADDDVVDLRSQLTDAQHLLDERAATIAQLEAELAALRGDASDTVATPADNALESVDAADGFVDAAADAATAPDTAPPVEQFDVDDTEITDEVLAPGHVVAAAEPPTEAVEAEPVGAAPEPGKAEPVA
ncbi:MAG TPA: hypothetical protein VK891_15735, partial [Euzebyales bacterium]|nr:hypothetical protein [Euzebyales bacterium]